MNPTRSAEAFIERLHARVARTWLTDGLIAACVLAFLSQLLQARVFWAIPSTNLLVQGADFGPLVQEGQVWRLFSSLFLHGSPLHLVFNMLALWEAGQLVERIFGRRGMLLIYLGGGLVGSLASIWWRANGLSVGASGAIFGLYGALLMWLLRFRHEVPLVIFKPLRKGTLVFIIFSLFAGVILPGIDNAAHVGGLIGGSVLGAAFALPLDEDPARKWRHWHAWAGVLACTLLASMLWRTAPQVAKAWEERVARVGFSELMREFVLQDARMTQLTQSILDATRRRQLTPEEAAQEIRSKVLSASVSDIDHIRTLEVAPADAPRKRALLDYASLRYQSRDALARFLETGQRKWLRTAAQYEQQAQAALLDSGAHEPARDPMQAH